MEEFFSARTQDVLTIEKGDYDAVLFMESFPVMNVALFSKILVHAHTKLRKPTGLTYLYHNLKDETRSTELTISIGKFIKPRIKYFLGVDFGRLTTRAEMEAIMK